VLDMSHSVFWDESSECSRGCCVQYCIVICASFLSLCSCCVMQKIWCDLKTLWVKELLHFTVVCRKF
jgi:hypothetical protein